MTRKSVGTAVVTVVLVLAAACSDLTGPDTDLRNARARWLAHAPASYSYTLVHSCFCVPDSRGPVIITVRNGVVESRKYAETGVTVPANYVQYFPAVNELFAQIDSLRANRVARLDVTYDATYGFPTLVEVDVIAQAADDEFTYESSAFVAR